MAVARGNGARQLSLNRVLSPYTDADHRAGGAAMALMAGALLRKRRRHAGVRR